MLVEKDVIVFDLLDQFEPDPVRLGEVTKVEQAEFAVYFAGQRRVTELSNLVLPVCQVFIFGLLLAITDRCLD